MSWRIEVYDIEPGAENTEFLIESISNIRKATFVVNEELDKWIIIGADDDESMLEAKVIADALNKSVA